MKLLSWNVQWCRGMDGVVSPARIVTEALKLADPDVICLQEVAVGFDGLEGSGGEDQVALLAACLPGWHLAYGAAVNAPGRSGPDGGPLRRSFGNLIATRLPVLMEQHHPLPMPPDPQVPAMPRMCSLLTVQAPGLGPLRIMTTHLEYYSDRQRLAQAQAVRQLHAAHCALAAAPPGRPQEEAQAGVSPFDPRSWTADAVLCGDFNAQAGGPELQALGADNDSDGESDSSSDGSSSDDSSSDDSSKPGNTAAPDTALTDAWPLANPGRERPPTFRLHDPSWDKGPVSCDFVLVSQSLKRAVRSCSVDIENLASDHQPVWIELAADDRR